MPAVGSRARAFLIVAAMSFAGVAAHGAEPDAKALAKARQEFQQALAAETAGDYAGALALFRDVSAVRMTPQVRFHIAICEDKLGRLVAAVGDYQLALADATDAKADEVVQEATQRLEAAKARVPKLVIKRGAGAEFATMSLDGVALGASSIGAEIPVDPGPHTIEAKAPGGKPTQIPFSINEKEKKTVEVTLAAQPAAAPSAAPTSSETAPPPSAAPPEQHRSVLPYVVGGVGVASLAASGVFFLLRSGAIKDLDAACGPTRDACPPSSKSTYDSGKTYSLLGDVTLGVGVVGVGAGIVLLVTQKPATSETAGVRVVPSAPGANAGASLLGRF